MIGSPGKPAGSRSCVTVIRRNSKSLERSGKKRETFKICKLHAIDPRAAGIDGLLARKFLAVRPGWAENLSG